MKKDDSQPATKGDVRRLGDRVTKLEKQGENATEERKGIRADIKYLSELVTVNSVKIEKLESRLDRFEEKMDRGFAEIKDILRPMTKHISVLDVKVADHEERLVKIGA